MDAELNPAPVFEEDIEDHGNGEYTVWINKTPFVKVIWLHGVRQCLWQVHGPADLDFSIAMMQSFLHLTALLANEPRVYDRPPNLKEPVVEKVERKWQTSKTIRQSKSS